MNASTEAANFDRVARIYRWAEYFAMGRSLQRVRAYFIATLSSSKSALVLGDGDGRFLAKLLAANMTTKALAVDTSANMLALLRKRCAFAGDRVQTQQASALTTTPPPDTDLVVTHFFLDCLTQSEVEILIQNVASHCKTGMIWLVSDFQVPHNPLIRPFASAYIRTLYLAFKWLTGLQVQQLPNTRQVFLQAGFTRIASRNWLIGMLYTELWRLDRKQ